MADRAGRLARRLAAFPRAIGRRRGLGLLAGLLAIAAVAVWMDKHGLKARYVSHFDERPVMVRTDGRLAIDRAVAGKVFHFEHIFSVDWQGWIEIEQRGPHGFRVSASSPARLAIDGQELLMDGGRTTKQGTVALETGLHRLEIAVDHSGDNVRFTTEMRPPGGEWGAVPARRLFDRHPGPLRRWIRGALGELNPVARNLVALALLLLALIALAAGLAEAEPPSAWRWLRAWAGEARHRRWLGGGALALVFVIAALAIFPRVGSPFGFDDVRYLNIAAFNLSVTWVINRYAHVYLLDLFIWLSSGDAFLGARVFWSVQFGLIVAALVVAAKALGPRLQTATFGVSLFLLFCQPLFFLRAGASVPDTTVGTMVMVAVALYLHRLSRKDGTDFEWQILLIGAITVWAVKSKELGVILLWLLVLFLFECGKLDWRAFRRKVGFWLVGAAAGLALLMVLDGIYFKDPLYGLRAVNQKAVSRFNFAEYPQQERSVEGWMDIVAQGKSPIAQNNPRMPYMALLVVFAALLAAIKRRSIELRLLHFMPVLYFLMLMLIHVRATYVFLARYLYPIVPLSCFLGAAAFHYLELDELRWRDVRSPRFFVPALLLGFLVFGIVVPYEAGSIEARDFLPAAWLDSIGWSSLDAVVDLVAAPALVLTLFLALALFFHHRAARLLLAISLVLVFLGTPFYRTAWELRTRRPWQRGEANLHGLRVLGDEIPAQRGSNVAISTRLINRYRMFGVQRTCPWVVSIYLHRSDFDVDCWPAIFPKHDVAFITREEYRRWRRSWPALEDTAVFSPGREIVVVRPSEAGEPPGDFPP